MIETTSSGDVPQVTTGGSFAASRRISLSKTAPSSERSVCQNRTASSQAAPFGAFGRSFR